MMKKEHLPNLLTGLRLALIPLIIWQVLKASQTAEGAPLFTAFWLFTLASFTDWLDGVLARRWQVSSPLGAAMDHIADKLLIIGALVALMNAGLIFGPAVIAAYAIIFREVIISGLREGLAGQNVRLPVNFFGKSKTALQMLAVAACLLLPHAPISLSLIIFISQSLVIAAGLITVISGLNYIWAARTALGMAAPQSDPRSE